MKSKTKKFFKISMPILGISAITASVVCLSGVLIKVSTISIGGSTAVLPLINSFANYFTDIDIVTSAGGSGIGVNSIIEGTKEIGMASKNPEILPLGEDDPKYRAWKEKQVKTLTIAWDGIGILYKPTEKSKNDDLIINKETLAKIYHLFSGYKEFTFNDLLGNFDDTKLIPFARNGGAAVSGTTDGFLNDSHINYNESLYWQSLNNDTQSQIINSIEKGGYGSYVLETEEANSQAWNRVKNSSEGSIIYLSSGFILNNLDEIQKHGFKIAKYEIVDEVTNEIVYGDLTQDSITKTYNWYRPFNLIYSIDQIKNNNEIKELLKRILFWNESRQIIINEGYVPLTNGQLESMGWDNNQEFFIDENTSDINLGYSGAK